MGMTALIWDIGRLLWVTSLLMLIVWAPAALSTRNRRPPVTTVLEHFVVTAMLAVIAVSLLGPAKLLNPFTLLVAYSCWPLGKWLVRHRGTIGPDARTAVQAIVLKGANRLERAPRGNNFASSVRSYVRVRRAELFAIADSITTPVGVLMAAAVLVAIGPTCADVLVNTRLPNSHAYGELLTTQQLFAGELGWGVPRVVAALTAAISVVSSIAPVHLMRLLVPIAGVAAFVSLITTVRVMTGAIVPAIIAAICAAVLWPATAQLPASEISAVFVLLSLLFVFRTVRGGRDSRWLAITASLLVALLTPALLVVVGSAAALMLLAPAGALIGAGAAWLVLSWITPNAAPLGWALTAAGLTHLVVSHLQFTRPPLRTALAAAVAILGLAVVMPRAASASYVEYDAAARATLDIATRFPKYRWTIAAPVEQWALSYGRGWHINLHEFVEELSAHVNDDGYRLPYKVDELFVFVETRPFTTFDAEPADVPFRTLVDPVYRHYRSPAGRASLQFAAYELCERLRQQTPGATVYFDDGRLKIYRFTLR